MVIGIRIYHIQFKTIWPFIPRARIKILLPDVSNTPEVLDSFINNLLNVLTGPFLLNIFLTTVEFNESKETRTWKNNMKRKTSILGHFHVIQKRIIKLFSIQILTFRHPNFELDTGVTRLNYLNVTTKLVVC